MSQVCKRCYLIVPRACQSEAETGDCPNIRGDRDKIQIEIAMDTVKNPMKALLGGMSAEEAERLLREKFGWSENRIYGLKLRGDGEARRAR